MKEKGIDRLGHLVVRAQNGDRTSLESLVRSVQDHVYHLAMRMLADRDDALEATQEILILIVTKLSTFRAESLFSTWVYRVATNYLITAQKKKRRASAITFESFKADLENGLAADPAPQPDDAVMLNQLRVSCTMAMLLCLDLNHRIAYVLGDILEFDHSEAADIIGISKDNYRQRLSRARRDVIAFTSSACGLSNVKARCTCSRRLPAAKASGRVVSGETLFPPSDAPDFEEVVAKLDGLAADRKTFLLQTATPKFQAPKDLSSRIAEIVSL